MIRFYEDSSKPKLWAKDLREKILKKYNYGTIAKNYDTAIGDALKAGNEQVAEIASLVTNNGVRFKERTPQ
jgi:hypothetical protein